MKYIIISLFLIFLYQAKLVAAWMPKSEMPKARSGAVAIELNNRIYVMKITNDFQPSLPPTLIAMAEKLRYDKIFAKVTAPAADYFTEAGYNAEAVVPGFYNGSHDGVFLSYYLNTQRACESDTETYERNLTLAHSKQSEPHSPCTGLSP